MASERIRRIAREIIGPCEKPWHDSPMEWYTACRCYAEGMMERVMEVLDAYAAEVRAVVEGEIQLLCADIANESRHTKGERDGARMVAAMIRRRAADRAPAPKGT